MTTLVYYIKPFFLPPLNFILLALIGWLCARWWPLLGRSLVVLSLAGLLVLSLPVVSALLLGSLQTHQALDSKQPVAEKAAIVVLAAGMYKEAPEYGGEDTAGGLTLERLRYAAKLHRDLGLPILATGGIVGDIKTPLAEAMAKVLNEEFSVDAVWTEPASRNTQENATHTEALLRAHDIETVYLVTHSWHMRRAILAFETAGVKVIPAPTRLSRPLEIQITDFMPSAGALFTSYYALHEWLGQLWYLIAYS